MNYQVLLSLKNNEKVFINVVCCSPNWHFKGQCINKMSLVNKMLNYVTFCVQKHCYFLFSFFFHENIEEFLHF